MKIGVFQSSYNLIFILRRMVTENIVDLMKKLDLFARLKCAYYNIRDDWNNMGNILRIALRENVLLTFEYDGQEF